LHSRIRNSLLAFFLNSRFRRLVNDPEAILRPYVRQGQTVADIGCGPGFFTMALAKLVGSNGHVIAIDLEKSMLETVRRNARKHGLESRIAIQECTSESTGLKEPVDFVLCFWVMHEIQFQERVFSELYEVMKKDALLLIAEPWAHVGKKSFEATVLSAEEEGLVKVGEPKIRSSYSILLSPTGRRDAQQRLEAGQSPVQAGWRQT
jgi:ubiquinone/menaquinone biosynthesis C-methylase UbiE